MARNKPESPGSKGTKASSTGISRRSVIKALAVAGSAAAVGAAGCLEQEEVTKNVTKEVYVCPYDGQTFDTQEALKQHIEEEHMPKKPKPKKPKKGRMLVIDYYKCTGCMVCSYVCAAKYGPEIAPDATQNNVNLEYARIRTSRYCFVDTVNVCRYCTLQKWAEGTSEFPCEAVCPADAILTIPEGEGKEGYYGMGYKKIDRDACLSLEDCGKCLEICEEQFGSGLFFDPEEHLAQVCTMCGGLPACEEACPEDAIEFAAAPMDGRYFAHNPAQQAEMLYWKLYDEKMQIEGV